ncbi:hypothetical protein BU52_28200 [Streptomyces toyocaensis]|uniref:Uncharacterized protein n=1 Tax=Streptomyces toyocaensis TaxID=55952 RepID=A0A081XJY5_STRTO|nr:hypothetical protein [Streptomyces toyocaensis]KES03858.1 hypothetical protein BU52_28200 [Streptomyces toyocaensis]
MTARAGEPFDTGRAVSDIEAALSVPLPDSGPAADEGEPGTGEWRSTRGEGFLLLPLWESEALTGVYGRAWNDAEARAQAHLAALVAELDRRWGPHRTVTMGPALLRRPGVEPFRTLVAKDCNGDLALWGPVPAPDGRLAAVSLNQSDGDAPLILTALVMDRPLPDVTVL